MTLREFQKTIHTEDLIVDSDQNAFKCSRCGHESNLLIDFRFMGDTAFCRDDITCKNNLKDKEVAEEV